jgi:hypothetical protein
VFLPSCSSSEALAWTSCTPRIICMQEAQFNRSSRGQHFVKSIIGNFFKSVNLVYDFATLIPTGCNF